MVPYGDPVRLRGIGCLDLLDLKGPKAAGDHGGNGELHQAKITKAPTPLGPTPSFFTLSGDHNRARTKSSVVLVEAGVLSDFSRGEKNTP